MPTMATEDDLHTLQTLLDALPAPLEPLDVMAVDGYLCGVLLQPQDVAEARWLPPVLDLEGRAAPPQLDLAPLRQALIRRHDELQLAIARRQWFDPWVYELDEDAMPSETVLPWVAGFATAMELFPKALDRDEDALTEPLALLYRHLDPEDLEDADDLLAEIETLEPPATLDDAVEDLVRAVLLMADVTRPRIVATAARPQRARRPGPGGGARRGR
ncbi:yecA family protein [Burkholderiales bacterium JOSHI_001]|nr:yecA family protein [Burkholderiales bacterium JOSHI_001]